MNLFIESHESSLICKRFELFGSVIEDMRDCEELQSLQIWNEEPKQRFMLWVL